MRPAHRLGEPRAHRPHVHPRDLLRGGDVRGRHDRQGRIKVYGDRMVYVQTDDGCRVGAESPRTDRAGELLLEAMSPLPAARETGERAEGFGRKGPGARGRIEIRPPSRCERLGPPPDSGPAVSQTFAVIHRYSTTFKVND